MKAKLTFIFSLFFAVSLSGQVKNPKFKKRIDYLLKETVPFISVDELVGNTSKYLLLDAREKEEFEISRIEGAKYFGYDHPSFEVLDNVDKGQPIVVYCSIGYRSEKIGEQLKKMGFTNVKNLYGSIFEWSNRNFPLCDDAGEKTQKVHTYNKRWSKWVNNPEIIKVH